MSGAGASDAAGDDVDIERNRELADRGELDELLRQIDRLAERRAWAALDDVRVRSRAAFERGHQLWPAAANAAYRLALEAPGEFACTAALDPDARFTMGPLTEVLASTHRWEELEPHLPGGPERAVIAHERVIRGEDLTAADIDRRVLEIPLALQPWEPRYTLGTYRAHDAEFPAPKPIVLAPIAAADAATPLAADDVTAALAHCTATWTERSNGRAEAVAIEGTAEAAIATLAPGSLVGFEVSATDAMSHLAWAAASGGAEGERRGMAAGRFDAWWTLAAATNLLDAWPVDPDELRSAATELRYLLWHTAEPASGWELYLAIEDPLDGLAWAIAARDDALE